MTKNKEHGIPKAVRHMMAIFSIIAIIASIYIGMFGIFEGLLNPQKGFLVPFCLLAIVVIIGFGAMAVDVALNKMH